MTKFITIIFTIIFLAIPIGSILADHGPAATEPDKKIMNFLEINPLKSLNNVTAPLDNIWRGLGSQINIKLPDNLNPGPLKALDSQLGVKNTLDNISVWQTLGMFKEAFIIGAQILVVLLEVVLQILRSILGLII